MITAEEEANRLIQLHLNTGNTTIYINAIKHALITTNSNIEAFNKINIINANIYFLIEYYNKVKKILEEKQK